MDLGAAPTAKATQVWPKALPDQIAAVREALEDLGEATPDQLSRQFKGAGPTRVLPLLQSLVALGQAEEVEPDRFAA